MVPQGLARAMLRVATLHSIRGTPKSAEYYADQALGFADDVGSSRLSARALVARADVRVHVGNFDGADEDLGRIEGILGPVRDFWTFSLGIRVLILAPL